MNNIRIMMNGMLKKKFTETSFPHDMDCMLVEFKGNTPVEVIKTFMDGAVEFSNEVMVKIKTDEWSIEHMDIDDLDEVEGEPFSIILESLSIDNIPPHLQTQLLNNIENSPCIIRAFYYPSEADNDKPIPLHLKEGYSLIHS